MPTTRKQKKARKSREAEMLSDIENLDIMLGGNHFDRNERNESVNSNQAGRPESLFGDEFGDENENEFPNPGNNGPSPNTELGHNSIRECSSVEINRLSSELNSRISREMDEMMNSVSVQIQRAINEAISSQILPQIQNAVMAGSGQLTKERWNVPTERPEGYSEVLQNLEPRNNSKSKQTNDRLKDGFTSTNSRAYDTLSFCCQMAQFLNFLTFWVMTSLTFTFLGRGGVFWWCFWLFLLPLRFSYLTDRPS